MAMDREGRSYGPPGGALPPGPWIMGEAPVSRHDDALMVAKNNFDSTEDARERDVEIIRHAIAALTLHRAEVAVWDELAIREEVAERDGLAPEAWRVRREALQDAAHRLGRRIECAAANLAQLTAGTSFGVSGKLFVCMARESVEADTSTGALHALRLSLIRDAMTIDAFPIEGSAVHD